MKYILISGPPGAGKDTVTDLICEKIGYNIWVDTDKFASPLMEAANSLGFDMDDMVKDIPDPTLGITRRDFQIAFSEQLCKPLMGEQVFGRALVSRAIESEDCDYVIVSDSGFLDEATAVIDAVGLKNVIRLHIRRIGHNYSKDSRSDWACPEGLVRFDIDNSGDMASLSCDVSVFCDWLEGEVL